MEREQRVGTRRPAQMVGLNVVPMIGVILAVLVVLVAVVPMTRVAVLFDMPLCCEFHAEPDLVVFVSLRDTGQIYVGRPEGKGAAEIIATWSSFDAAVDRMTGGDRKRKIFLRADQGVPYADVLRIMDRLHARGYRNTALVTEDVVD
jgi:biopolymer transport protein ExbD